MRSRQAFETASISRKCSVQCRRMSTAYTTPIPRAAFPVRVNHAFDHRQESKLRSPASIGLRATGSWKDFPVDGDGGACSLRRSSEAGVGGSSSRFEELARTLCASTSSSVSAVGKVGSRLHACRTTFAMAAKVRRYLSRRRSRPVVSAAKSAGPACAGQRHRSAHRVRHRRERRNDRDFTDSANTEAMARVRDFDEHGVDHRQVRGHRHAIVEEAAGSPGEPLSS